MKELHQLRSINYWRLSEKDSSQSNLLIHSHLQIIRVKLAKSLDNNLFYAIKIIKRHKVESINLAAFKKILTNEVALLKSMNHPNIIKLVDYNCGGEVVIKPSGKAI